ncbi:flavin reductase family protein [Alteribacillus sp. YIM 98480]|uniref:flavin reductase family protein n=1 Tax=Alteribacillus sp. YIM 98480 TaxID=2606599 RepID=UPI00131A8218|nr:flavin reductase family protein [Alteribacillus sp. YIM 98480]
MQVNARTFRNALGCFSTGVTVITVHGGDEPHAMTANAVSSVSLEPPILLICVDHRAKCLEKIQKAGYFGVNVLKNEQLDVSKYFANQKVEGVPSFSFETEQRKAPFLADALVNLECHVVREVEVGDHTVFFGEVHDIKTDEGDPLCFYKGKYRQLAQLEGEQV